MTDVTVEILNLDKKESITIDILSNQDFTEVMKILCKMFLIPFLSAVEYMFMRI